MRLCCDFYIKRRQERIPDNADLRVGGADRRTFRGEVHAEIASLLGDGWLDGGDGDIRLTAVGIGNTVILKRFRKRHAAVQRTVYWRFFPPSFR